MTVEPLPLQTINDVDSWVEVLVPVGDLAKRIADTDFVPAGLRANVAAVAAAILTGRELGVPPMIALANIHVINGKPGLSALLMRQLVLSAGHELRYETTTDTRCVVKGRRRGESEWTQVTFTAEQARTARIDLGRYPEDKLVARATARLARRIFADVIGGMPYLAEEWEDDAESGQPPAPRAKRTAKRADAPLALVPPTEPTEPLAQVDEPEPEPEAYMPPLPGEPESQLEPEPDDFPDPTVPATREQVIAIRASLGDFDIRERPDVLMVAATLAGRLDAITSTNDLTKADASAVLDTLRRIKDLPEPEACLSALVSLGSVPRSTIVERLTGFESA